MIGLCTLWRQYVREPRNTQHPASESLEQACAVRRAARDLPVAQYTTIYTHGWAADSSNQQVRLREDLDRANQEIAFLREELRIKDVRLARIEPHRRPHYPPPERMAILQLRAARGWSLEQSARVFHVTAATIASWMKRLREGGADALVQLEEPVNRFPDFVRYMVQ